MAKGVLCFFYDICYDIEIMEDEIAAPRSHSSSNTDVKAVDVQVFPNPVDDNLTVFLSELPEGDLVFQLFDPMGRNLISQPLTDHYTTVSLNKLSPGLYYYRVLNDGIPIGSDKVVKR
jgi:hypothetical protein